MSLDERSGSHPLVEVSPRGALDWRIVGLVALLAGGGGGTLMTNTLGGASHVEIEKLGASIEAIRAEQAVQSRTLVEIRAAATATDRERERIEHEVDDHEKRLQALERKAR